MLHVGELKFSCWWNWRRERERLQTYMSEDRSCMLNFSIFATRAWLLFAKARADVVREVNCVLIFFFAVDGQETFKAHKPWLFSLVSTRPYSTLFSRLLHRKRDSFPSSCERERGEEKIFKKFETLESHLGRKCVQSRWVDTGQLIWEKVGNSRDSSTIQHFLTLMQWFTTLWLL